MATQPELDKDAPGDTGMDASNSHHKAPANKPSRLVRSRRRRYLALHPSYFTSASADLQLSDPLSYDRLIRQHQSAEERQAEGKAQGWAKTLESSLLRGEAKLAELQQHSGSEPAAGSSSSSALPDWSIADLVDENADEVTAQADAKTRAQKQWQALIVERFVAGRDEEFDYTTVDDDDRFDADDGVAGGWAERHKEEKWFEEEEAGFEQNGGGLEGETGVQDY